MTCRPWQTAYSYLRQWRDDGACETIHSAVREQARKRLGRDVTPSATILGSQSAKSSQRGSRGYDAHKKVMGRKRHLLVDTQGFALKVVASAADLQDRQWRASGGLRAAGVRASVATAH